ncbi:MAG TPA: MraY family glycosyltransferase, partial [Thermomicrobiales bacterium]|nr:MraY family glycosyltransferase [Thermomicrobiales bacterium]
MDRGIIAALTGLTAFLVSFVLVRQTIPFATSRGILDSVGPRKVNPNRLPRIAGPAILVAFLTGLVMTWILGVDRFPEERNRILLLCLASILLVAVMLVDDIRGIPALIKLGIQVAVALIIVGPYVFDHTWGIVINQFNLPIAGTIRFGTIATVAFSIFWIVGMMNTINLIDGLDGLAASLTIVACTILFLHTYFWPRGNPQFTISLLAIALGGAVLGFLPFNWHPSRIILGDAGAYFLGLGLAVCSIIGGAKIATAVLALGLPILDVAWVAISRIQQRKSPIAADRGHLHHRLLDLGWSQARITATVALVSLAFGIASLLLPNRGLKLAA